MAEVRPVIIKIGTVIFLEKENGDDAERYKSRVVDLVDDTLMIDYPVHVETGKTVFMTNETALLVSFTDELKMSYSFKTKVQGRRLEGVPMLQLLYRGDDHLIKIQRREFVRVDVNLDVAVEDEGEVTRLVTADISAGGLAINLPDLQALRENATVKLVIVLPFQKRDIEYVRAKAKIVRIWEEKGRIIASLEFLEVSDTNRQQIVQFCFERQLQLKKKLQ